MALEIVCAGICPACGSWDATWRGVDTSRQGTEYLFIDCDTCDPPPPSWLRARLDRWAA